MVGTTSTRQSVQISGEAKLIETELPSEAANAGAKNWMELRKDGDKWVGTAHERHLYTRKASQSP